MFRKIVFCCFLLLGFMTVQARHLSGRVVDAETGEDLIGATVELLSAADSSVIRSTVTTERQYFGESIFCYTLDVENNTRYLLRISMVGYKTLYVPVEAKMAERMNEQWVDDARLKVDTHVLDEVVVKATKIKMVMKGDTVVYNADAFNLSEGSMLDALVRQLPGVTLESGVIKVNGRAVSTLLIDGRDFFNGDAKKALENLPAYTVSKVRVYDKQGKDSRLMGRDMGDKALVVDVGLKKQYNRGFIGNADVAVGSKRRYSARLFAMHYGDKSRLTLTGTMNNVNDRQPPGEDGALSELPDAGGGRQSTRRLDINYYHSGKDEDSYFSSGNSIGFTDNDQLSRVNSQTFLTGGDYFHLSSSSSRSRLTDVSTSQSVGFHPHGQMIDLSASVSHTSGKSWDSMLSGQFNEKPWATSVLDSLFLPFASARLMRAAINRQRNEMMSRSNSTNYNFTFADRIAFGKDANQNMTSVTGEVSYGRSETNRFGRNSVDYLGTSPSQDHRAQYVSSPAHNYTLTLNVNYSRLLNRDSDQVNTVYVQPFVRLSQNYNASDNALYRLDRLADYTETAYPLGVLPSTRDALLRVLDAANSYQSRRHVTSSYTGLSFNYTHGDGTSRPQFSAQLYAPVQFKRESLSYDRVRHYHRKRNSVFFEPTLSFTYQNTDSTGTRYASLSYGTSQNQPDLSTLLDIHDDSNPLVLTLGNPDLKKSRDHHVDLMLSSFSMAHQLSTNVGLSYHTTHNAIATSVLYDKATGRTTTQQVNINGNWGASANYGLSMPLDKSQHLSVQEELACDYDRSVDLMSVSGLASVRSKVNNWNVLNTLKLTWQLGDRIRLNFTSNVAYQRATGDREGFTTVSAWRYNFGLNGNITLPWNFEITTDFTNYNRRGYNDSQMNTSEEVWNLRLTKKLLKGNLTLSLDGFDLLGQLNNTAFILDTQGRTETWTSSIPRYVLFHVAYKLHK